MTRGFKDPDGNFHPTENNHSKVFSGDAVIKFDNPVSFDDAEILKMEKKNRLPKHHVKEVFTFDELSESAKEKAREWVRSWIGDDWFDDYDGLIYDKKSGLADYDVFDNYTKKYYDLDRGQYIQFPDLKIKSEEKFGKMLDLPESLVKKIYFNFENEREYNTRLVFKDENYNDIDFKYTDYETYRKHLNDDEKPLSKGEFARLEHASQKWDDMMHNAWVSLRDNYEYQFTDKAVDETIESNEYEFDSDGNRI